MSRLLNELMSIRATHWRLKSRTLSFDSFPQVMGIVNVTPDSFSDGGQYLDPKQAVDHAMHLVEDGADIIDIGGESTRPYSQGVDTNKELQRTIPVVTAICESVDIPVSIDTSKSTVAKEAIEAGAEIINDVTGLEGDPDMVGVALQTGAGVCAMHMQGTVQTMQADPRYGNVVEDIFHYLQQRKLQLVEAGIDRRNICLDPGIGFGKTHQHNIELIQNGCRFLETGCPILIGHSRKGFIGKLLGDNKVERDSASTGIAMFLAQSGVQMIRLHQVGMFKRALLGFEACRGKIKAES